MITRQTSLSKNIVQFCRFLRLNGFGLTAEDEAFSLQALALIDYGNNAMFQLALKAALCRSKNQLEAFDNLFYDYWKELGKAVDAKEKEGTQNGKSNHRQDVFKSLKTWLHGNKSTEKEETATYSLQENFSQKDFSMVPENEVEEMMRTIKAMAKRLAAKTNRRYIFSCNQDFPDMRKTLRKNMRHGGELLYIIHRKHKRNRVKIILLCDVSKSMELYSAFLIQFVYAFQQVIRRMETFIFSTSLQRISGALKQRNFREAMHLLSFEKNGWGSGTRIGESLDFFVNEYGKNLLHSKTIVVILSDGWDTGNIELLEKNLQVMQAKVKKLIWLNPLAGYESYSPTVSGMQAAMPFIDVFAPAHNIESLKQLGRWL